MKTANDKKTPDLLPEYDLAGERPAAPTSADKARARLERYKAKHGVKAITLNLPVDLVDAFDAYIAARNAKLSKEKQITKNSVIAKLISTQLLRPR
jgi:hypothetical protein